MLAAFEEAVNDATKEIQKIYKETETNTHYILFLEYIKLTKILADLEGVDLEDEKTQLVTEKVYHAMPHKEKLLEVLSPLYFPDATAMMHLMSLDLEEVEKRKQLFINGSPEWSI
ncbi:MAG: hypothetical protein JXQ68_08050 [Campylobacterales bacterium]|nr:hypothetical protein [Campylobacterales bacterium]